MITIYFNKENKKKSESIVFDKIVKLLIFAFCIFTYISNLSFAEEGRPKIGLVLSGGGAKGIAHIGILKTLEEVGLTQVRQLTCRVSLFDGRLELHKLIVAGIFRIL